MSDEWEKEVEDRLKLLEQAVFELSVMAKYLKYGVIALIASLGVDVQGMM